MTTIRSATQREPEAKETWRATDKDSLNEFREKTTFKDWEYGVGDIVKNSDWIIKVRVFVCTVCEILLSIDTLVRIVRSSGAENMA